MNREHSVVVYSLFPAVAMALGWGLRGFIGGGFFGAMIPGAMVALALCLLLGRGNSECGLIAAFGAVGVGLGGVMTYGQTVGFASRLETMWWGLAGLALKGAIWGLLAGAILGLALTRERYGRRQIVVAIIVMIAATVIGWKLINEPKLIYFSDPVNKPREEIWAGLALGALALIAAVTIKRWNPWVVRYAMFGFLGGGVGFGGGGLWMTVGRNLGIETWAPWWKFMEYTFGFCLGLAFGYCTYLARRELRATIGGGTAMPGGRAKSLALATVIVAAVSWAAPALEPIRCSDALIGAVLMVLALYSDAAAWQIAITLTYWASAADLAENFHLRHEAAPAFAGWAYAGISTLVVWRLLEKRLESGKPRAAPILLLLTWACTTVATLKVAMEGDLRPAALITLLTFLIGAAAVHWLRLRWLLVVMLTTLSVLPAAGKGLTLVQGGESAYSIVIPAGGETCERRAADELQRFLEEMSGARLPLAEGAGQTGRPSIRVRTAPQAGLDPEGFALKTSGRDLLIEGGGPHGTLYGVYTLLDRLGCRWYAHDLTVVPKRDTVVIPALDETRKPGFEYREVYIKEAQGKDWAAHNRLNGHFSALAESTGGKVVYYPWCHSFSALVPPEKHFQSHPEYYSLIGGRRRAVRGQLCLSNPEVLRIATETALGWIREHPEATFLSISQNDGEGWCECENCRRIEMEEGGHSGLILRFVNEIAKAVEKVDPKKRIDTLAYLYSEEPPRKARPWRNVRIRMAPIGNCQAHPYESCPRNRRFMANFKGWSKITDQLYVWHYITDFAQYLLPYPNFDELAADIPMYHRNGVRGLFMQGAVSEGGGGEFAELRSWVLARMLWDPSTDFWAAVDEFLGAYYGKAAPYLREYIDRMHRVVKFPPAGLGRSIWAFRSAEFPEDFASGALALFDKAERAERDAVILRRIAKARLSVEWLEVLRAKRFVVENGRFGPRDPAAFHRLFDPFVNKARGLGITHLHEWYGIDQHEEEFRRYVRSYPVRTLESNTLRADVVPSFDGRVMRLIHKRTGRDGLKIADADERMANFEFMGGISFFAHPGYLSRERYAFDWQSELVEGPAALVLRGVSANGLIIRRRIELGKDEPLLHTVTTVENRGAAALAVAIQARAEVNTGDPEAPTVTVRFPTEGGSMFEKELLDPSGACYGHEEYGGANRPAGEWTFLNPAAGVRLTNRFRPAEVDRIRLLWRGRRQNTVQLSVWSPGRVLAPGEAMNLEADYVVE